MANENEGGVEVVPELPKRTPKYHVCQKCGKEFPGTGKRGRPSKYCPECRAAALAVRNV